MAKKQQRRTRSKTEPFVSPADSAIGRLTVMVEDMQQQLRVVADGIISSREAIERQLNERFEPVNRDLAVLKLTARLHTERFDAVDSDLAVLKASATRHSGEFRAIKKKLDVIDERDTRQDRRLAALEKKAS